eukprot:30824-Pelagococcus_subviridis.AAC.2
MIYRVPRRDQLARLALAPGREVRDVPRGFVQDDGDFFREQRVGAAVAIAGDVDRRVDRHLHASRRHLSAVHDDVPAVDERLRLASGRHPALGHQLRDALGLDGMRRELSVVDVRGGGERTRAAGPRQSCRRANGDAADALFFLARRRRRRDAAGVDAVERAAAARAAPRQASERGGDDARQRRARRGGRHHERPAVWTTRREAHSSVESSEKTSKRAAR